MMPKVEYTALLLGATGNVGGRVLQLLVQSPLRTKVVVVTRRNVAELANPKVQQVVVNMDKMEEELAPHARGVDIALAAFGVGKGSAKMADAVSLPLDSQERPGACHGRAVGGSLPRTRAGQRPRGSGGEDSRVPRDEAVLRGR